MVQQLTRPQRILIVELYHQTHSYQEVQREFHQRFPDRDIPSKSTISRNVKKLKENGTVLNLNPYRSGRVRTV